MSDSRDFVGGIDRVDDCDGSVVEAADIICGALGFEDDNGSVPVPDDAVDNAAVGVGNTVLAVNWVDDGNTGVYDAGNNIAGVGWVGNSDKSVHGVTDIVDAVGRIGKSDGGVFGENDICAGVRGVHDVNGDVFREFDAAAGVSRVDDSNVGGIVLRCRDSNV